VFDTILLQAAFLCSVLGLATGSRAAAAAARQTHGPASQVPLVQRAPTIDGNLDDDAWVESATFTAFKTLRPAAGRAPSESTEVRMVTHGRRLYVAVRCVDRHPELMRAHARDETDMAGDDWVLVALDTHGDGLAAYFFAVNPAGTQADGTLNWDGQPDMGLDLRWESAVRRDEHGYTVEFAVPLEDVSHPWSGPGRMGFKVARYVSRRGEEADYPELRVDGGPPLTQMRAIALPAVPPSVVPATTMIANHLVPPPTPEGFDLGTLEGRSRAWGAVEVSDRLLFPSEPVSNDGPALRFPTQDRAPLVREFFAPLEYREETPIGYLEDFLTRTATAALIVLSRDTVIYEQYFNGYGRDTLITSFSVAKSFVSTMVGAAVRDGLIGSVRDPISRYLPELGERDPRFSRITVEDLLRMSSGLRYVESGPYWDDAVTYYDPDLRAAALNRTSIERAPGERFFYNNYNPLLIGLVLERVTGMSVPAYLQRTVWEPLGMEYPASWSLDGDSTRFAKMESGLNARAIDYAKLGELYLHGGCVGGRRILPADWVTSATQPSPRPPGFYPVGGLLGDGGYYGYFWWGRRRGAGPHDFFALGNKGEFIYVSPQTHTVIVRMGVEYGAPASTWIDLFYEFATRLGASQGGAGQ